MSKITTIWTYQLNNVQTEFAVNFDYLSRKFVVVTLIGKDRKLLRMNVDYRFIGAKTIKTSKAWGSNDGYQYLEVRRVTSATDLIVDFSDGSILRAGDLTTANLQSMHIAEEARNLAGDSLGVNDEGNLDARARRIVNLGDPVGRKDAVHKAYVDDAANGVIDSRDKTLRYRNEAQGFRNEAESFKNQASTYKTQAEASKNTAVTKAQEAANSAASIQNVLSKVTQLASQAQTSASEAKTSQTQAKASEVNAKTSETNSKKSETSALGAANKAATSEANALRYAEESRVAQGAADRSEAAAVRAEAAKNTIIGKETVALEAAKQAEASKTAAANSAQAAKTSETNAKKYADSVNPNLLMPKTGGTFTGEVKGTVLTLNRNEGTEYTELNMDIDNTRHRMVLGTVPSQLSYFGRVVYRRMSEGEGSHTNLYELKFPKKNGTLAIAEDYIPKTGGTFSGYLNTGYGSSSSTGTFNIYNTSNKCRFQFEFQNNNQMIFWCPTGNYTLRLPKKTGTLAVAEDYVPKTGGTFSGVVNTSDLGLQSGGDYSGFSCIRKDNSYIRFETGPSGGCYFVGRNPSGSNLWVTHLPKKSGTLAVTEDIPKLPAPKKWVKVWSQSPTSSSGVAHPTITLLDSDFTNRNEVLCVFNIQCVYSRLEPTMKREVILVGDSQEEHAFIRRMSSTTLQISPSSSLARPSEFWVLR